MCPIFVGSVHNFSRSKNDKWKNAYFKYMWFHVQLAHKILSGIYSMYNNTQALAAAELQSFAGILQPHFHAHEITLKTNGTWPTQLFFAHPIKLFHFLLPSAVFGLVGEIEVTKWESDDYLLIRNCLAHRNAAGSWSVSSISMVPIVSNVHYLGCCSPNLTTNSVFI